MRTLAAVFSLFLAGTVMAENAMELGDGRIKGEVIAPYALAWRQCSLQGEQWVASNDLNERLVLIGDVLLRHEQIGARPDGSKVTSTTYFDRRSFAPLRMEQVVRSSSGEEMARAEHDFRPNGYSGRVQQGEKSKDVKGVVSSKMLHGGAMGLPLATLDYQAEPLAFAASMIGFDATYKVTASWAGKETFQHQGSDVDTWMIDVEWLHEESGDVYAPGPDGSGGRYWVVQNPPPGFPYVPRYKTDTYAVEFVEGVCPVGSE